MAVSYTIAEALSIANRSIPRPIEDDHAVYVANSALNEMWLAYDWRQTISNFNPFWLIPNVQDYGAPFYAVPTDFYGLRTAYIVDVAAYPVRRDPLKLVKNIRREYLISYPRDIGYIPETKSFRVYPLVSADCGASRYLIDGTYKTVAPQVTTSNLQTTYVPWDDIYINHFVAALRWAAADVADSPQKSTKRQELHEGLMDMAMREGVELGDQVIAPSEGLVDIYGGPYPLGYSGIY